MFNIKITRIFSLIERNDSVLYLISKCFFILMTLSIVSGCGRFEENIVEIVHVVLHPSSSTSHTAISDLNNGRELLLQASGWIEPDPYPVRVSSLYDGTIKSVFILEGEKVNKGQKLVSLINEDAKLSLELAQVRLDEAQSKELEISSEITLQELSLEKSKKEHLKAVTLFEERVDYLNRLETLPNGSVRSFDLNQTRFEVEQLKLSKEAALLDVKIAEQELNLLSQRIKSQKHFTSAIKVHFYKAQLDLNRTEIFSPMNGRVLKLYASPGKRLMQKMDAPEASTALTLYDEKELQARIDVPISEASKLFIGQPVEISCSVLPNILIEGRLTRIVGEADLQRNTLQVKVRIINPDNKLRPEMLCRAKFYSLKEYDNQNNTPVNLGIFVPVSIRTKEDQFKEELLVIGEDGKTVELRQVILGNEIVNDYISVLSGLRPGDQIIIKSDKTLKAGDSVKIINN